MDSVKEIQIEYSIPERERIERSNRGQFFSFIVIFLSVLFIIGFCRNFVYYSVVVDGSSMETTLKSGDVLLVNKLISPKRYDVVILNAYGLSPAATNNPTFYIKRVIAVEGETVWASNNVIYCSHTNADGETVTETVEDKSAFYSSSYRQMNFSPVTVPEGCYFVLGDNRFNSTDSRIIGCVPRENIYGVVPDLIVNNKNSWWVSFLNYMF